MDGFDELANAIVLRAVKDYRMCVQRLKRKPGDRKAAVMKRECERFFRSAWFKTLTALDGIALLQTLKEEGQNDD